jgi:hypothetical protein
MLNIIINILALLIPHFRTDDYALVINDDEDFEILCLAEELEEGEDFDALQQMSMLVWLNCCLYGSTVGPLRIKLESVMERLD